MSYHTKDLTLAACLKYFVPKAFKSIQLKEKTVDTYEFEFDDNVEVLMTVDQFFDGTLKVEPGMFVNIQKSLKNMIFQLKQKKIQGVGRGDMNDKF